jgi:hypothetical protein
VRHGADAVVLVLLALLVVVTVRRQRERVGGVDLRGGTGGRQLVEGARERKSEKDRESETTTERDRDSETTPERRTEAGRPT